MNNENLFGDFPSATAEQWKELIKKELKGKEFESIVWTTFDKLEFNPFYTQEDLEKLENKEAIPGHYPYVRGNRTNGNNWEIRQDIKVSDPKKANQTALEILNKGITSLGFITDSPELTALLKDILIEHISVNFINNSSSLEILNNFIKEVKKREIQPGIIKGSVNFDFLGEILLTGNNRQITEGFNKAGEIVQVLTKENLSLFRGININGNVYHNAGASIVQELAFSLAHANEYVAELTERKYSVDEIAASMQFTFSVGSSYLMEIAKLRAARMLWAKIIQQYNPKHECSMATYIHCQTSEWNTSIADAHNNLLRATTETMSCAIGGANSITVIPFDNNYKESDNFSERIARNIQIICAEEAHLNKISDPAGGSYYIEKLTDSIASAAWELFKETESKGGFLECIKTEFIQNKIEETAKAKNEAIATGKMIMVGVNKYVNKQEKITDKAEFIKKEEEYFENRDIKPLKKYRAALMPELEMIKQKTEL
ncbi:MAG: acyl-CoA mutase large subunit family protein [Bacteroidota bacterium]|nr:acyl-CoA mutase large subunit family protein [Bacteroidota bacterium]